MSSHEVCRAKSTSSNISDLVAIFQLTYKQNGVSPEQMFNQLLDKLGYESTGCIRPKKHRIELTDDVIKFLKGKEEEKANAIAGRKKGGKHLRVVSMDKNEARYLIIAVLMSFDCWRENHRVTKKLAYQLFDYKERTVRSQAENLKTEILKDGSFYNKLYSDLRSEIINNFYL